MNIALFGGTFDPVHCGHLSAARAAQAAFSLDQIHFIPARVPPHKRSRHLTAFPHRHAMVALACAGTPGFIPSILESRGEQPGEPNYSILTVRRMAAQLSSADRLFFLIGADAFLEIGTWKEPVALLDSLDFIIVSRPGFVISRAAAVIPPELQPGAISDQCIHLRRTRVHLLTSVEADISSSEIRRLASEHQPLTGLVPEAVEEYIQKLSLYQHEDQTE
ncbi:MAG: nicotinate (nicotinamide) nucleotide adenylyltransferase [Acidobacteria bacterium]|nr:nicotinate (nicotinamide) nucleotide adenylyltransferase [Acidobacteriota bacterium]